ncbi:kremen protein 1-like [Mytilus edulis]|uniref:kremen protein 1-like n=1 Tax=Mytilus edulis TaxID=6550 RepID=UPI0039EF7FC0
MKFVFVLAIFIVCAAAVTIHQVKNTRQCKAEDGICKQTCAVDEDDTGPCCRNSYRCCHPSTCNDSLQYAQCKAKHGESKPVCNVNEQDTGIGPFCNGNRCCEPPTCNTKVDCNCKSPGFRCPLINEYLDIAGNCSGSNTCCKPCCLTCGGTFNGPEGIFTSTHYPSKYCYNQICRYTIKVEEGSKVMLNFTFFDLEYNMWGTFTDTVQVYDGEISTDTLMATLDGGPFEGLEFNSTSNKMIIVFKSDDTAAFTGFSAIYKTLK